MKSKAFRKSWDRSSVLTMPDHEWIPGTIYAVIGANGSGKSTLAKTLSGTELSDQREAPLRGVSIGYLPQKPFAYRMRVEQNLFLNGKDSDRAKTLMDALGLTELRQKRAKRLSGGETAKMALARLLMRDYELLILDEPTASMDMESTLAAEQLLLSYRDRVGCAVILITHSLQQARRVADHVLFFDNGELIEEGSAAKLLSSPESEKTKQFLTFYGL